MIYTDRLSLSSVNVNYGRNLHWTLELRRVWCSNNLKLEQKLESRTKNHVVQWASRKFSLFLSVSFISLGYFYINSEVEQLESGTVSRNGLCSKFEVPLYFALFYDAARISVCIASKGKMTVEEWTGEDLERTSSVKYTWSYTFTSPYVFLLWCSINHGDTCTFMIFISYLRTICKL
jgi:hypothetical protein